LFKKAAGAGYAPGAYQVGMAYLKGRGVQTNLTEAIKWIRKAADANLPAALGVLACRHYGIREDAIALDYARRGAEAGDAMAEFIYGHLLDQGKVVPRDVARAVRLWRLSAEQGWVPAASVYGWSLLNGEGVEKNEAEAIKWLRIAAEQDDAAADVAHWSGSRDQRC